MRMASSVMWSLVGVVGACFSKKHIVSIFRVERNCDAGTALVVDQQVAKTPYPRKRRSSYSRCDKKFIDLPEFCCTTARY
jgi:hypothetical protein